MSDTHIQSNIAEFMYKNLHLLGFENLNKPLLVATKELLDNSIDAANNVGKSAKVFMKIESAQKRCYKLIFKDFGPGVSATKIPKICCSLLYGSKLQSNLVKRGQQGIGLTALALFAQKTTNTPIRVVSKHDSEKEHEHFLRIDIAKNKPQVLVKTTKLKESIFSKDETGIYFEFLFKCNYPSTGKKSLIELLKQYSLLNPSLHLTYVDPEGQEIKYEPYIEYTNNNSVPNKLIAHHLEYGDLVETFKKSNITLEQFLEKQIETNPSKTNLLKRIINTALNLRLNSLTTEEIREIHEKLKLVLHNIKPKELSLLGNILKASVTDNGKIYYGYDCYHSSEPSFYANGVLQTEIHAFYDSSNIPKDDKIELIRVANCTPLIFQNSSCAITKAVSTFNWKQYGFTHTKGQLPKGSLLLIVHVTSNKVPYNTESKESVAPIPAIKDLLAKNLQKVAKDIKKYVLQEAIYNSRKEKEVIISQVLPELTSTLARVLKKQKITQNLELKGKIMDALVFEFKKQDAGTSIQFYNPTDNYYENIELCTKDKVENVLASVNIGPKERKNVFINKPIKKTEIVLKNIFVLDYYGIS